VPVLPEGEARVGDGVLEKALPRYPRRHVSRPAVPPSAPSTPPQMSTSASIVPGTEEELKALASGLQGKTDPGLLLADLGRVDEILQGAGSEKFRLVDVFEEAGGLDTVENLQLHEDHAVYRKANFILRTHFVEDDDDDDDVGGFDFEDDDEGFEQSEVVLGFNEPVKDGQGGTVLGMQTLGQVGAEPEAQVQATSFTKWKTKEEASGNSDTGGCQGSGTILSKEGLQDSKTNAQVSPASETDVDVGTIDGMKSLCAPLGDHSGVSSPSNEEINTILDTIIGMLSGCDDKKRQSLLETITEVGALDHIETLQEHEDYDIYAKALKVLKFFEEY